jgi:acetolactate synthase-1/2/3 large subunit
MKLSDYVAQYFVDQGVKTVFVLTGGCIVHLIDSVGRNPNIEYLPVQHEQSGAMAADAYARISENIGVTLATSGPGATNLLTGVCCAYYDSIPMVVITGQVPASQLKRDSQSRQIGFQETDVVSIFKPITKFAVLVDDPRRIRYELEKAFWLAKSGRPGPVLLDLCDDVQRAEITPETLEAFIPPSDGNDGSTISPPIVNGDWESTVVAHINEARRPIFIFGGGIRLAGAQTQLLELITRFKLPFTLTWAAIDYVSHDHPLYVGGFGVTSGRPGNFAVQNADLIIAVGTRLDTHEAGSNLKTFARQAKKIVVDIDDAEQIKYRPMGMPVDLLLTMDAKAFLFKLAQASKKLRAPDRSSWLDRIKDWKSKYPICLPAYKAQECKVNPYVFMEALSSCAANDAIVVTDCGSNLIWTMQGFEVKGSQRIISAFNHSPMGYSLPASIGAALVDPARQVICIIGDGGLQINIQELATIYRHSIDIKIFVMNNHGHGIIQGTQDNWLDGRHHASDPTSGGLPDPNFQAIARAYGLQTFAITEQRNLATSISQVLSAEGAVLCDVDMLSGSQIAPKLLFGRPIEDADPLLPRDEFLANMLIPPLNA